MKKAIYILFIMIWLLSHVSCRQSQKTDYQSIITYRAQHDTVLSYSGITLGDPLVKYGATDKSIIDIKDEQLSLPEISLKDGMTWNIGSVPARITIEQHSQSGKVDAIVVEIPKDENILESIVRKYIDLYGVFSYYEVEHGSPGSMSYSKDRRVPNSDNSNSIESILQYAKSDIRQNANDNFRPLYLSFAWQWKSQKIYISTAPNNIYITFTYGLQ